MKNVYISVTYFVDFYSNSDIFLKRFIYILRVYNFYIMHGNETFSVRQVL